MRTWSKVYVASTPPSPTPEEISVKHSSFNFFRQPVSQNAQDGEQEEYSRRISGISESDQRATVEIVINIASKYSNGITIQDIA